MEINRIGVQRRLETEVTVIAKGYSSASTPSTPNICFPCLFLGLSASLLFLSCVRFTGYNGGKGKAKERQRKGTEEVLTLPSTLYLAMTGGMCQQKVCKCHF